MTLEVQLDGSHCICRWRLKLRRKTVWKNFSRRFSYDGKRTTRPPKISLLFRSHNALCTPPRKIITCAFCPVENYEFCLFCFSHAAFSRFREIMSKISRTPQSRSLEWITEPTTNDTSMQLLAAPDDNIGSFLWSLQKVNLQPTRNNNSGQLLAVNPQKYQKSNMFLFTFYKNPKAAFSCCTN